MRIVSVNTVSAYADLSFEKASKKIANKHITRHNRYGIYFLCHYFFAIFFSLMFTLAIQKATDSCNPNDLSSDDWKNYYFLGY